MPKKPTTIELAYDTASRSWDKDGKTADPIPKGADARSGPEATWNFESAYFRAMCEDILNDAIFRSISFGGMRCQTAYSGHPWNKEQARRTNLETDLLTEIEMAKAGRIPSLAGQNSSSTNPDPMRQSSPRDYFIVPGRFAVGGITKECGDYVFHDLELPVGCWDKLTLKGALTSERWTQLDWASKTFPATREGISPVDVRYGLAVVSFLNRRSNAMIDVVRELHKNVLEPDLSRDIPVNATVVLYRENNVALVAPGYGWDLRHPFGQKYAADIAAADTSSAISIIGAESDPSTIAALEALLGENDPQRCKEVLTWASYAGPLDRRNKPINAKPVNLHRLPKNESWDRGVILCKYSSGPEVDAAVATECMYPARFIRADPKDYHRK